MQINITDEYLISVNIETNAEFKKQPFTRCQQLFQSQNGFIGIKTFHHYM